METKNDLKAVKPIVDEKNKNAIELATTFAEIKKKKKFRYGGYKSFKDFVSSEYFQAPAAANKLVAIWEIFYDKWQFTDDEFVALGVDKVLLILPWLKKAANYEEALSFVEQAKGMSYEDMRELLKTLKEKTPKTNKEIFVEQFKETFTAVTDTSWKEAEFLLALYFQDEDYESIKEKIKIKKQRLEDELSV